MIHFSYFINKNKNMDNIKKLSIQKAVVKQITKSKLSHLFDKPKDPNDTWIHNN